MSSDVSNASNDPLSSHSSLSAFAPSSSLATTRPMTSKAAEAGRVLQTPETTASKQAISGVERPHAEAAAYGKTLNKVERIALKILAKLFSSFETLLINQISIQADKAVTASQKGLKKHQAFEAYEMDASKATDLLEVPAGLELSPKDLKMRKEFKSPEAIAAKALAAATTEDVPPMETEMGTMLAYRFEGVSAGNGAADNAVRMIPGKVSGTSHSMGTTEEKEIGRHLTNVYVIRVNGKDYGIIRTGKIDTKQKADEFVALVKELHAEIAARPGKADFQMRVVSQQLNSFEGESAMINAQHRWMAYANDQLYVEKEPGHKTRIGEVVHLNMPSNAWVRFTKKVTSLRLIGAFFAKYITKGERLSHLQNLDGLGAITKWVGMDVGKALREENQTWLADKISNGLNSPAKQACQEKINQLLQAIDHNKMAMKEKNLSPEDKASLKKKIAEGNQELKNLRAEMRAHLLRDYHQLMAVEEFENTLGYDSLKLKPIFQQICLARQLLGSQLGIAPLDRGKELMVLHNLNDFLGVTAAMNCKSGLDRTGIVHAIKLALNSAQKSPSTGETAPSRKINTFELINGWEANTKLLNRLMATLGNDMFNKWLAGEEISVEKRGDLLRILGNRNEEEFKTRAAEIIELRKGVLSNVIRLGIPITAASTGIMGMKWHKGMQENPIPSNFLPAFIKVEGEAEPVQIMRYDSKTGEPIGLTPRGHALFTKFQSFRGS